MKRFKKKIVAFLLKVDGIQLILSLLLLSVIFYVYGINGNTIDLTIFTSILILPILHSISKLVNTYLLNIHEDDAKLTNNYQSLIKMYQENWLTYKNKGEETEEVFPVICDAYLGDSLIQVVDNPSKQYQLPELIDSHYSEIFAAHNTSTVYNQANIRVDNWFIQEGKFVMETSRTTYFHSLVTNRAVDFSWEEGRSIRDLFLYGPYFPKMSDNVLSNHLGFNGFVESQDGYLVFVMRGNKVSIGKSTYGISVGASLKVKYCLKERGERLDFNGIEEAIICEIQDELKIAREHLSRAGIKILSAYRDIVEGGKPQLLFYAQSSLSREDIEKNFYSAINKANTKHKLKTKEEQSLEDGDTFYWIHRDELKDLVIKPSHILHHDQQLHMVPSAASNIVMLMRYWEGERINENR